MDHPVSQPAPAPRRVRKVGGSFEHTGTVVAEFRMLHIYRPDQVADLR